MTKLQEELKAMIEEALDNWTFDNESLSDDIDGDGTKINLERMLDNITDFDEYLVGDIVKNRDFDKLENYVQAYR